MIALTCPHCGLRREVPPERIPQGRVRVTCPGCQQSFSYEKPGFGFTVAPATVAAPTRYAGFWIRVLALLIDSIVFGLLQVGFSAALGAAVGVLSGGPDERMGAVLGTGDALAGFVLSLLYYVGLTGYDGQTLGKKALGLKVVRGDGSPVGYGRAALRETVGKFLSAILLGVGYLMVAFDARRQGLHDKLADTCVVRL